MKTYKIATSYIKNGNRIDLVGKASTLDEAKEMAVEFQKHLDDLHIDIFLRTPIVIKNTETKEEWELQWDDGEHFGFVEC